jgi:hypothetical protein
MSRSGRGEVLLHRVGACGLHVAASDPDKVEGGLLPTNVFCRVYAVRDCWRKKSMASSKISVRVTGGLDRLPRQY